MMLNVVLGLLFFDRYLADKRNKLIKKAWWVNHHGPVKPFAFARGLFIRSGWIEFGWLHVLLAFSVFNHKQKFIQKKLPRHE
jgi:hypothetical protein